MGGVRLTLVLLGGSLFLLEGASVPVLWGVGSSSSSVVARALLVEPRRLRLPDADGLFGVFQHTSVTVVPAESGRAAEVSAFIT